MKHHKMLDNDEWDDWGDEGDDTRDDEADPEQEEKISIAMQRLRNFQFDLADDMVLARINKELRSIPFDKLMQYYRKKSNETDLASLTIKNELNRMEYEVIYEKEKTADKEQIVQIFGATRTKEIWCLANQSIYGDILTTLQMYFLSSELCITINNSDSKFVVDVDSDTLHSESAFTIGCNKMVELASIKSSITVSIRDQAIKQVLYSPELKVVFDADLHEAAAAVVEIERVYQCGGAGHAPAVGRGSGLREKLENIDIEAVRERLLDTSQVVIGHVGGFLTQLPVVNKLVENLQADGGRETWRDRNGAMEGIIDFTDTTGLGQEPGDEEEERYYDDSDEDEPGPVAAIAGTLFQWGGAIGSNIVSGVANAIEKVKEDQAVPKLYRREGTGDNGSTGGNKRTGRGNRSQAGGNSAQEGYSDLPGALPAAASAGLTFSKQEQEPRGQDGKDLLGLSAPLAPPNPHPASLVTTDELLEVGPPSSTAPEVQPVQYPGAVGLLRDLDFGPPPPVAPPDGGGRPPNEPNPNPPVHPEPTPGTNDSVELRKKTNRRHR